jgi:hypothetical protein
MALDMADSRIGLACRRALWSMVAEACGLRIIAFAEWCSLRA